MATQQLKRRRVVLCTDFDQTLTVNDTIALLFQAGAAAVARQHSPRAKAGHDAHVQQLVAQYASDMDAFLTQHHSNRHRNLHNAAPDEPTHASVGGGHASTDGTSDHSFDAMGLHAFLDGYAAVDMQSIARVADSRLLRGIRKQDLVDRAKEIALMDSCVDVLAAADDAFVVSSNWSFRMLDAALNSDPLRRKITIITNDLATDASGVTTGELRMRVQSPRDKAQWVERIRASDAFQSTQQDRQKPREREPLVAFVGDSANDLLALLEADVGVVLTPSTTTAADSGDREDSSSVVTLAERFGAKVESIASRASLEACACDSHEAKRQGRRLLFTASSWAEIGGCAFR